MQYFFHVSVGGQEILDESGIELSDTASARMEGLAALYDIARERIADVQNSDSVSLRITTENGRPLGVIRLTLDEEPADWADSF